MIAVWSSLLVLSVVACKGRKMQRDENVGIVNYGAEAWRGRWRMKRKEGKLCWIQNHKKIERKYVYKW